MFEYKEERVKQKVDVIRNMLSSSQLLLYAFYMSKTIFQKIIDREIPAHIVYEDDNFIVFLDIHPEAPGHCQVVPKEPYRWVWDHPDIGAYFTIVQKIALAQRTAFNVELIRSNVYGDEVPHAHVWVWPLNAAGDPQDFEGNAEKIREALKNL